MLFPPAPEVALEGGFLGLCARSVAAEQAQAGGIPLVVFHGRTGVGLLPVHGNSERYGRSAGIRQGEMLLQGIGGKLPAQTRTVEHAARAVVDEGRPVDAPFVGVAEHHIHALVPEKGDELLAAVCPGKRGGDGTAGRLRQTPVADLFKPALYGFVTDGLADAGSLEGSAGPVTGIISGGIDHPVILAPVHHATGFLHGDVVEREQSAVFAHCLELVACHDRLGYIRYLPLDIALRYVHPAERVVGTELAAVSRVQPVLLFQLGGDALAAAVDEVTVKPPAPFVHIDGNDVQVVAADV